MASNLLARIYILAFYGYILSRVYFDREKHHPFLARVLIWGSGTVCHSSRLLVGPLVPGLTRVRIGMSAWHVTPMNVHTHECWMDSGILQFRILYILPVQFLTHAFTECEPAVCLLAVL
jgi:hypothetical protein